MDLLIGLFSFQSHRENYSLKIGTTKSIFTREIANLNLMQGDMTNVSYQI